MDLIISFPNVLCLLLTGVLVVHMLTRDPTVGNFQEQPGHLEAVYCRIPQSYGVEDTRRCSSTRRLFWLLGNDCSPDRKPRRQGKTPKNITESFDDDSSYEDVVTVELAEETETEEEQEEPEVEMTSSLVDSFVISLLLCSVMVSLLEWYREKTRRKQGEGVDTPGTFTGGETSGDRRISLANLTVNRHIRRRDSQQAEIVKLGSKPPLLRRSSFPAQFPEVRSRHAPQRQQSTPGMPTARRMSIDLGDDDSSPDRRRVRIIRRH